MIARVEQMVMKDRRLTVKQDSCQCRHIRLICGHHLALRPENVEIMRIMSSDRLVCGRGSFGLFSHDVRPSLNCHTHERTFLMFITPSLHVSLNC